MTNDRLLKGFNYFWNKKPSNFKDKDVIFLHEWMKLLKESAGKENLTEADLESVALQIFGGKQ